MAPSLSFSVRRQKPVLIAPARPTPREFKPLSDIDDQQGLSFHVSGIHFYQNCPSMAGRDPARVICEALAQTLVFYYPLAGRLREMDEGKLVVECNEEGALFVEADAAVRLEHFGNPLQPPFPCVDELLYNEEGCSGIVNCPLFFVQVTRLECGGFIFAHKINHTVADAAGVVQFIKAMAELACGTSPTVTPVWERELILRARNPPSPTHLHPEYKASSGSQSTTTVMGEMVQRSFFFGPREISALRAALPASLRNCSRFETLTGFIWRSRTMALCCDSMEEVRVVLIMNGRGRCRPRLPAGYYGNTFAFLPALSLAGELCCRPAEYAVQLVREAKADFSESYLQSVADLMVLKGRPHFTVAATSLIVSDLTRIGFEEIDFGWGEAAYAGPAMSIVEPIIRVTSFYIRMKNWEGEEGILVPMCLPAAAMERFQVEYEKMTMCPSNEEKSDNNIELVKNV